MAFNLRGYFVFFILQKKSIKLFSYKWSLSFFKKPSKFLKSLPCFLELLISIWLWYHSVIFAELVLVWHIQIYGLECDREVL